MSINTTAVQGSHTIEKLKFTLVIITSMGMLYNNIIFGKIGTYPFSLPLIFTVLFYLLCIPDWLAQDAKIRSPFFLPVIVLLIYQFIVHGWIMEGLYNIEWVRSFALLTLYGGIFLVSGPIKMSRSILPTLARIIVWISIIMGSVGIIQFALANMIGWQPQLLPEALLLRIVDLRSDSLRFGGIVRATGLAYEPSFYGTGMVMALSFQFIFLDWYPDVLKGVRFSRIAMVLALGGLIASLSLAAWGVMGVILILRQLNAINSKNFFRGIMGLAVLSVFIIPLWPKIENRWTTGNDYSMIHRIWSSIELIVAPGEDLLSSLIGTGVGLDSTSARVWEVFISNLNADFIEYLSTAEIAISIVNGFSYIAVSSGWIGLAVNIAFVLAAFRFSIAEMKRYPYILAAIVGYFFTNARYLWPEWWFLLLMIVNLYDGKFQNAVIYSRKYTEPARRKVQYKAFPLQKF